MKILAIALLCIAAPVFGQYGPSVNQTAGPPNEGFEVLNYYDGSNNLVYQCKALGRQKPSTPFKVSDASLTNIVVAANVGTATTATAHGFQVGNRITVAGSATAALNADYIIATAPSTTTFTVATSGVANATYNDSTLTISTRAPRSSAAVWSIQKFTYTGTVLNFIQWAEGTTGAGNICDNRAASGATAIAYQ